MSLRPGVSRLAELARERACEAGLVVFEAPTGYGKTRAGPLLYRASRASGCVARLLHALPLRAIVEEAYSHYRESLQGASVGYQAHGLGMPGKAPFYAPDVVVTTMDSLAFNLFRASVGERGLGHYEVPRAHILSSIVILDEAHLPLSDPSGPATAMVAIDEALLKLFTPVVIETATLPPAYIGLLASTLQASGAEGVWLTVAPRDGWEEQHPAKGAGFRVEEVDDSDYYEWAQGLSWLYDRELAEGAAGAARRAAELAEAGLRVFLASSTVKGAVEAFRVLREETGDGRAALIHGRLAVAERMAAIESAKKALVIVGTSAVEAGVNIDADAVVTDVPRVESPGNRIVWESIIQRLGRACRDPRRRCGVVRVVLYGSGAREVLEALTSPEPVNPRIPYGRQGYARLLRERPAPSISLERFRLLVELARGLPAHDRLEWIHEILCTPFRNDLLVPIAIPPSGWSPSERDAISTIEERLERGWYVPASLGQARRRASDWLYQADKGILALTAEARESPWRQPENLALRLEAIDPAKFSCRVALRLGLVALIARPEAYEDGVGLL